MIFVAERELLFLEGKLGMLNVVLYVLKFYADQVIISWIVYSFCHCKSHVFVDFDLTTKFRTCMLLFFVLVQLPSGIIWMDLDVAAAFSFWFHYSFTYKNYVVWIFASVFFLSNSSSPVLCIFYVLWNQLCICLQL